MLLFFQRTLLYQGIVAQSDVSTTMHCQMSFFFVFLVLLLKSVRLWDSSFMGWNSLFFCILCHVNRNLFICRQRSHPPFNHKWVKNYSSVLNVDTFVMTSSWRDASSQWQNQTWAQLVCSLWSAFLGLLWNVPICVERQDLWRTMKGGFKFYGAFENIEF